MPKYEGEERRQPNGTTEWMQGLPVWMRAILQIVLIYGPLTLVALYLVYRMGENYPALEARMSAMEHKVDALIILMNENKKLNEEILSVQRYVCAGVSKNETDRRACFDERVRER